MNNIWVLSLKTSLPDTCENASEMETEFYAFENFETAKEEVRNLLKNFAFSKNSMFDGNGDMIHFKKYVNGAWEPEEDDDVCDECLSQSVLSKIYDTFKAIFEGKESDLSDFHEYYFDGMIGVYIENGKLKVCGEDDGPCNGYSPTISTNMFDLSQEQHYFMYIDDMFGQYDASSELYIDLKKVEVQ